MVHLLQTYFHHGSLVSFPSFLIIIFILATGSFCVDSNVRTLFLGKALWISLKILSLLFSSNLITAQQRWQLQRRLHQRPHTAGEAGGFLALGLKVSIFRSFAKCSGCEIPESFEDSCSSD